MNLTLPTARIRFAKYQYEFTRAYMKGDQRIADLYASLLKSMFISVACGYELI